MTTGSTIKDSRTFVPYPFEPGTPNIGPYVSKIWSGGDRPKIRRYKTVKIVNDRIRFKTIAGKRTIVQYQKIRFKSIRDIPPKIPKSTDQHPYTCDINNHVYGSSVYWRDPGVNTIQGENSSIFIGFGGFTPSLVPVDNNAKLAALGELREKIAGSSFNAGVFLAEGPEALRMIGNAASRIYKAIYAVKRGHFRDAARALTQGTDRSRFAAKVTASNWLELQYGWLPLLNDVHDGAQYLAHYLNAPQPFVVKARRKFPAVPIMTASPSNTAWSNQLAQGGYEVICHLTHVDQLQLVGLTDPLSVVWEKLPYSFVVDWFIPIGNYLSARGLSQALSGTFVETTFSHVKVSGLVNAPLAGTLISEGVPSKFERIYVNRSVGSSLSVPLPSAKPLSKVLGWQHAANAVSLLTNLAGDDLFSVRTRR
jgi:hypothetical protein